MRKSIVPIAVSALLLGACSPAQYKVNPPSPEKVEESVPESQQAGYMRILGDLRWDQLTSKQEWIKRFPECLTDKSWGYRIYQKDKYKTYESFLTNDFPTNYGKTNASERMYCKDFVVGGIPLSPGEVYFGENTGTESKTMATKVRFVFFEDSKSRAFKSAIAQKYAFTTSGYCSKFTCWDLGDVDEAGIITAKPTPYAVSILDNVKVDKSDI